MKIKKLKHLDTLEEMNISKDDFVIYGSAPLVLRGLKEKNNDLDILTTESLWDRLKVEYPNNMQGDYIEVNGVSFTHNPNGFFDSTDEAIRKADVIDGYHVMNLTETVKWKEKTGVTKHLEDAGRIKSYLSQIESKL